VHAPPVPRLLPRKQAGPGPELRGVVQEQLACWASCRRWGGGSSGPKATATTRRSGRGGLPRAAGPVARPEPHRASLLVEARVARGGTHAMTWSACARRLTEQTVRRSQSRTVRRCWRAVVRRAEHHAVDGPLWPRRGSPSWRCGRPEPQRSLVPGCERAPVGAEGHAVDLTAAGAEERRSACGRPRDPRRVRRSRRAWRWGWAMPMVAPAWPPGRGGRADGGPRVPEPHRPEVPPRGEHVPAGLKASAVTRRCPRAAAGPIACPVETFQNRSCRIACKASVRPSGSHDGDDRAGGRGAAVRLRPCVRLQTCTVRRRCPRRACDRPGWRPGRRARRPRIAAGASLSRSPRSDRRVVGARGERPAAG
jgi:hypothetical protein